MPVPRMRMGLVGFADEKQLLNLLMSRNRNLQWERWPFIDADALWINGAHAQPLRGNLVRIPSVDPAKPATVLNLKEIDRPTAFTLPFANGYFTPPLAFDPHKVDQVADVLNVFEAALLDTAAELTLASEIAARRHGLAAPSYHLMVRGRLLAIFNASGEIGLAPQLAPHELEEAEWAGRPAAGGQIPGQFRRTTIAQVMWNHVMRSADDLLPSRYREGTIHWRRMPAVPPRWIREEHMMLIAVLSTGPQTVASLSDTTGLSPAAVSQGLAALYFGGSLTTDPRKAGPTRVARAPASEEGWPSSMTSSFQQPQHVAPPRPGKRARADMPTVPSPLEPRGNGK